MPVLERVHTQNVSLSESGSQSESCSCGYEIGPADLELHSLDSDSSHLSQLTPTLTHIHTKSIMGSYAELSIYLVLQSGVTENREDTGAFPQYTAFNEILCTGYQNFSHGSFVNYRHLSYQKLSKS